jgi:hypothetical protein
VALFKRGNVLLSSRRYAAAERAYETMREVHAAGTFADGLFGEAFEFLDDARVLEQGGRGLRQCAAEN